MTLKSLKKKLLSTSKELLLLRLVAAVDAEADVHAAADALVRHHLVRFGVLVQSVVDEMRLLVGDLLLSADLLSAELGDKVGHDLACDPEVEDGEGVVERVVLGDGGIVEDDGAGETTNVQAVQESSGRSRGLRGEKVLANDSDGDAGDTDVLLGAAL